MTLQEVAFGKMTCTICPVCPLQISRFFGIFRCLNNKKSDKRDRESEIERWELRFFIENSEQISMPVFPSARMLLCFCPAAIEAPVLLTSVKFRFSLTAIHKFFRIFAFMHVRSMTAAFGA